MKSDQEKALDEADERLKKVLPEMLKNHKRTAENATEEPETLRTGTFDEVRLRRSIKEQKNEKLSRNSKSIG